MLRRIAAAQPAPGPSLPDHALTRPPYPPANSGHELRRTTAAQPAPGPSHEDTAQPRHRQLPAASGAPATQPAPPSTQGYSATAATHTRDRLAAAPASAQPTGPPGSDILPDGDETFADFVPPQFAVPTHSIGEEQLRRAGLDLSCCNKWRTQLQPCGPMLTPHSRLTWSSEGWGWRTQLQQVGWLRSLLITPLSPPSGLTRRCGWPRPGTGPSMTTLPSSNSCRVI